MLIAFANAFRTPDLRRKLLFVLMILAIFRLGSQVPTPGVDVGNVQTCIAAATSGSNASLYSFVINFFCCHQILRRYAYCFKYDNLIIVLSSNHFSKQYISEISGKIFFCNNAFL